MGDGGERGGTLALCELTDEYGTALLADFRRFYGLDLAEALFGSQPVAPSLLLGLVEELPEDSALAAAVRGGPHHRGWTVSAHLLASVIDAVNDAAWITAQANSRKRIRRPRRFPRPAADQRRPATVADLARRFGAPEQGAVIRR
ncbi:hypothetical protein SSP35_03_03060 [Streptomyces sp. NBRC 110611]|uniref:hypothetical protein n=1 Tax=Streptomyces sp. NBRC 110611 TaxID=1621259 RepID=UPI00083416CF|nr:hypothetical protein [Streptomyces sp. NBRC 110611]GAU66658.1 hypothetical protein SSP35_03_03060 [Streptomyces sp. NBRC 110611]